MHLLALETFSMLCWHSVVESVPMSVAGGQASILSGIHRQEEIRRQSDSRVHASSKSVKSCAINRGNFTWEQLYLSFWCLSISCWLHGGNKIGAHLQQVLEVILMMRKRKPPRYWKDCVYKSWIHGRSLFDESVGQKQRKRQRAGLWVARRTTSAFLRDSNKTAVFSVFSCFLLFHLPFFGVSVYRILVFVKSLSPLCNESDLNPGNIWKYVFFNRCLVLYAETTLKPCRVAAI